MRTNTTCFSYSGKKMEAVMQDSDGWRQCVYGPFKVKLSQYVQWWRTTEINPLVLNTYFRQLSLQSRGRKVSVAFRMQ